MKRSSRWLITITIALVVGVVIYYNYINGPKKDNEIKDSIVTDEVVKVINKDLESKYPESPKEVVSLFVRIQKCYYNEEYTEEELLKLAYKATELFDSELINENPFDKYYENLKSEINAYAATNKTISQANVDERTDIVYSTVDGQKYAQLNCLYILKDNKGRSRIKETYILRKDENDRWKILGWKEYEESEWEK